MAAGDSEDEVWYAHVVKEQLRAVYRAADEQAARVALAEFYDVAGAAAIPGCDRLARTIRRWEPEVIAYYRSDGLFNGRTEAVIIWSRLGGVVDVADEAARTRQ